MDDFLQYSSISYRPVLWSLFSKKTPEVDEKLHQNHLALHSPADAMFFHVKSPIGRILLFPHLIRYYYTLVLRTF